MQREVAKLVLQQHYPLRIIVALVKRKGIALQEVPNAKTIIQSYRNVYKSDLDPIKDTLSLFHLKLFAMILQTKPML